MKSNLRYFVLLFSFGVLFRLLLALANSLFPPMFPAAITDILLVIFLIISLIVLIIFFSGTNNEPERKVMKTGIALSLKTLLSFIFAGVLFVGFKKKNIDTVILFFILYLGFTLFLVFTLLNALKKRH